MAVDTIPYLDGCSLPRDVEDELCHHDISLHSTNGAILCPDEDYLPLLFAHLVSLGIEPDEYGNIRVALSEC
jgi:hypothetical protein